jgi:hypothetical protein
MLAWCQADLAAASSATWKVVLYHKPTYDATYHDATPWGRRDFVPLFHQFNVDVVFAGHAHLYERFVPMDSNQFPGNPPVTYIVTGGGGAPLHAAQPHNFMAHTQSAYHYVDVTVNGGTISLSVRDNSDAEIDSVSWTKTGGVPYAAYMSLVRPIQGFDRPELSDAGAAYHSFSPATVGGGEAFSAGCRVRNLGSEDTRSGFRVSFYASSDTSITSGDCLIGRQWMPALSAGASADCNWSGHFPSYIRQGTYYVGWIIDSGRAVREGDETNNTAYHTGATLTVTTGGGGGGGGGGCSLAAAPVSTGGALAWALPYLVAAGLYLLSRARYRSRLQQ